MDDRSGVSEDPPMPCEPAEASRSEWSEGDEEPHFPGAEEWTPEEAGYGYGV